MDPDTGGPLDALSPTVISWAKSIGSKAKTLSEVLSTRDPLVRNINFFKYSYTYKNQLISDFYIYFSYYQIHGKTK